MDRQGIQVHEVSIASEHRFDQRPEQQDQPFERLPEPPVLDFLLDA
jgi:hypothetical protein